MTGKQRVLVTGFGAFPGVPHNVSSEIAIDCAAAWSKRSDIEVQRLILDTNWEVAPNLVYREFRSFEPDVAIHLGVSSQANSFVLETHAYNACDDTADACGVRPAHPDIHQDGDAHLVSKSPVSVIADALTANGLACSVSNDPGRYLCNAIYYEALTVAEKQTTHPRCIFIHLPVTFSAPNITRQDVIRGLDIVLETMLAG